MFNSCIKENDYNKSLKNTKWNIISVYYPKQKMFGSSELNFGTLWSFQSNDSVKLKMDNKIISTNFTGLYSIQKDSLKIDLENQTLNFGIKRFKTDTLILSSNYKEEIVFTLKKKQ